MDKDNEDHEDHTDIEDNEDDEDDGWERVYDVQRSTRDRKSVV